MTTPTDGRQLRWQSHQEQRRKHVIDAGLLALEEAGPGVEVKISQIAGLAGINRSVLYRYFTDRADLELAMQQEICAQAGGEVMAAISFTGTPREILGRTVTTYVRWAVDHPACLLFVERPLAGVTTTPLEEMIAQIAGLAESVMVSVVEMVGGEFSAADRVLLDPWVFGMIGGCMQSVRRWTSLPPNGSNADQLAAMISEATWSQIHGVAASRGIDLPDLPVESLVSTFTAR